MSREPSSFSVAFLLSTKVSSGKALGFRMRYLGDEGEAAVDRTGHRPLAVNGKDCLNLRGARVPKGHTLHKMAGGSVAVMGAMARSMQANLSTGARGVAYILGSRAGEILEASLLLDLTLS